MGGGGGGGGGDCVFLGDFKESRETPQTLKRRGGEEPTSSFGFNSHINYYR